MAKGKKLSDKLRLYYRGRIKKPSLVAGEEDLKIIRDALKECLPSRSTCYFETEWTSPSGERSTIRVKLSIGLKSTLRFLKQKITKAVIYDSSVNEHLAKYLIEFAQDLKIPVIEAQGLSSMVKSDKLKSVLTISLIDTAKPQDVVYSQKDPTPNSLTDSRSEALDKLVKRITQDLSPLTISKGYCPPVVEGVKSTGKSRAKKQARKEKKNNKV